MINRCTYKNGALRESRVFSVANSIWIFALFMQWMIGSAVAQEFASWSTLYPRGTSASGMGFALTSVSRDANSIYYNPGGLSLQKSSRSLIISIHDWDYIYPTEIFFRQDKLKAYSINNIINDRFALGASVTTWGLNPSDFLIGFSGGKKWDMTYRELSVAAGLKFAGKYGIGLAVNHVKYELDKENKFEMMDIQRGSSISIGIMGEGLLPGLVIGDATEKTGLGFGIAAKEIGNGINRETFDRSLVDSAQQISKSFIAFPTNVRMGLSIKWLNTKDLASQIAFDIRYLLVKDSEAVTANRWFSPLYKGWASYKPSLFFGGNIELKRKWKLMGGHSIERGVLLVDWIRNTLALSKNLGPIELSISRIWTHSTELNSSRNSWSYFMYGISTIY